MCGIAGKLYFRGTKTVDESLIRTMSHSLEHRGPDNEGSYVNGRIGFGFRRLAIIDLSPAGHQPMSNEDGMVWIVFNGEIYNFQELRPDLERRGHRFRSHTDTECIVHLYEEYEEGCLQHLRGMFAFAIWDEKKQKLFLARDRVGKKPLKYYLGPDFIVFASELKAVLKDPEVHKQLDVEAVHHALTLQYAPHPLTGFLGIEKLPPAHYLTVEHGQVRVQRYWNLDFSKKLTLTEREWEERIVAELNEAVRLRMIADVPLGAFLSGGIDSSAVVAMMAKNSSRPARTFSIGFKEETHNELPRARRVAELFQTNHTEFVVEPDALEVLDKLVYHYEEPYADSSAIPTYYVSKLTRQHVTVALNGDGGDENFAGYPWYRYQLLAARLERLPLFFRRTILGQIGQAMLIGGTTMSRRASIFLKTLSLPRGERYLSYFTSSFFTGEEKQALYTPEFSQMVGQQRTEKLFAGIYDEADTNNPLDQAMYADINSYLPDALLAKVDIASMANSLEARSPFLDHRFMEFTAQMPSHLKGNTGSTKIILRRALEGMLPEETLYSKKQGFMVPLDHWFRGPLRATIRERLLRETAPIHRLIRRQAIERIVAEHERGRIDHGSRLWSLLTLERWLATFFSS